MLQNKGFTSTIVRVGYSKIRRQHREALASRASDRRESWLSVENRTIGSGGPLHRKTHYFGGVCTENPIRVDDVIESLKLAG